MTGIPEWEVRPLRIDSLHSGRARAAFAVDFPSPDVSLGITEAALRDLAPETGWPLPYVTPHEESAMYLVRDIMYCKPGKVRAMVEKFTAMSKLSERMGMPKMRIMTDMCAERYWTVVSEMEVESLKAFEEMMAMPQGSSEDTKEFEKAMAGYHDLVDYGKREIYKIEG